jgi:hypothetical protein
MNLCFGFQFPIYLCHYIASFVHGLLAITVWMILEQ